ncbi:HAD hydrolase-like protein [Puniceicoccus vermicola]|uniref:HAD hydrolase-like protein n=1 Tax=Puniceicoccus vermicola TaxID=388746 RepID=A0A7X1AVR0_9BACT|nr:HAD hydrolase-like protein [Puniceicoccus vermicola]MBC2600893.1 HAD hydrolase-like protein [Puniceicoccus vermicola]
MQCAEVKPENLLFDLDGTLTDPKPGITECLRYALGKMGREAPPRDDLLWCIGPPLLKSFVILLEDDSQDVCEEALRHYRERFSTIGLFENSVYPEVPDVLDELSKAGMKLFVASSKPEVFVRRILQHFGLSPFFVQMYGSHLDGTFAEKADLIRNVLAVEDLLAEKTWMIGDRLHDVIGAKANGLRAVGVTYGFGSERELREAGADDLVSSPREVLSVLGD